ncbi:hypothetical protein I302_109209 [Kwoniella bestiolae CBS 10118]|uniref:Monooxygenase n=1 Tax=Kwoniella bestiolae CBS 10118 TaxID=1296100 RepID=A0A1B9FVB7_9TREE|nr:hypothetical protein I302_08355 [Kwoniella bestiolae CBS 10118]OCF22704.1 hypothetical protein I302_08355 [Kwoniella bestiolae CBS 10118]
MHVAIVGAGYSGLAAATTLLSFGHSVVIFESSPDVGGVWSSTNHYPGLKAQNTGNTYSFSSLPMPKEYPLHPDCQQIQAYLELYVKRNKLDQDGRLRLNTRVIRAEKRDGGWVLEVRSNDHQNQLLSFDYLICAAGVFNQPNIPSFQGIDTFTSSGGIVVHTSNVHKLTDLKDKNVVVIGFGKSACDVAVATTPVSKSVTLVARDVIWKLPTYLGGALHYSYLLLTRFGEALFPYIRPWRSQHFLNYGLGRYLRSALLALVTWVITIQLRLVTFGLLPNKPFETIARASVSLATPGFVDVVENGSLKVERGVTVESLGEGKVKLSDGREMPVDVIICGTGWNHDIPSFLPQECRKKILNQDGDWILYRYILPTDLPGLAFIGYNSSVFCPLTAEISSLWLASHLERSLGLIRQLPSKEQQRLEAGEEIAWLRKRTDGHHANGTDIVPFSLSNIDEMLNDLGFGIVWFDWLREWLLPVNPGAYSHILPNLLSRRDALKGGHLKDE